MLMDQTIPISLDQGVDTKTDRKQVSGKLLRLENAVFTSPKMISKRDGAQAIPLSISGGGSLVAPKLVASYQSELVCADSGRLYGYSPALSAWVDKGPYTSLEVGRRGLNKTDIAYGDSDTLQVGSVMLYAWSSIVNTPTQNLIYTYVAAFDATTGAEILPKTLIYNGSRSFPRLVQLAGATPAVIYKNNQNLCLRTITVSGTSVTVGAQTTIATTSSGAIGFDVAQTTSGAVLAMINQGVGVTTKTLNSSGAVVLSATTTDANAGSTVALGYEPTNGNAWVYWVSASGGVSTLNYQILSSTLSGVLATTVIRANGYGMTHLLVTRQSSSQQTIYYNDTPGGTTTTGIDNTYTFTLTLTGPTGTSPNTYLLGMLPYSKSFTVNSKEYAVFVYLGAYVSGASPPPNEPSLSYTQPTYFVMDLAASVPVARFGAALALNNSTLNGQYTPSVAVNGSQAYFACGIVTEITSPLSISVNTNIVGVTAYTFDFGSANTYQATKAGNLLCLNGGIISAYDGQTCAELGFHLYPEFQNVTAEPNVGGVGGTHGSVGAGTYNYIAVYEWVDTNGDKHQSPISNPIQIVTTSTGGVSLTVTAPFLTQKAGVAVVIYRTTNGGSLYYQVTDPLAPNLPQSGVAMVNFVDTLADASLATRALLYITGQVLDNGVAQPSVALVSRGGRLLYIDSENRNTVMYSKTYGQGTGLSLSGNLLVQVDTKYGDLTALGEMDEKLILCTDTTPLYMIGDGALDTGIGATFSVPQKIMSDVGCSSHRSMIASPNGLLRKTKKGIYLLDRALTDHYIGAEVEKYNPQNVTAATQLQTKSQIRFLTDSGLTLVYDYQMGQWSTFTNFQGYSADLYQGAYVYARTDGTIYQETAGFYLDGSTAFKVLLETGGLNLGGVQGFQRVRRFGMLGDFTGAAGHGVRVSAAYDFSPTFHAPVNYAFSGSDGAFQYRERLPIQKCESLSLLIEEVTTGASNESMTLGNLSFEAAVKRGMNKLPSSASVG